MTFSHHLETSQPEHPFAETIRILGKGKKGSRSLTQAEAYRAMKMILADEVLPEQLGAFLMLMRVKEETPEELAGFVIAARDFCKLSDVSALVDLDWATYAGKRRHLPWFLLSALLLAENGIKVFMHGTPGPSANRLYTQNMLAYLGLEAATSVDNAKKQLAEQRFSYLDLEYICPKLNDIIQLRPILGLRSPVHTLVKLLNPFNAEYSIQGIFHPSYRSVHQQAAVLVHQPHAVVLKGEGGETERNPDVECLVQSVHKGEMIDETWPALFTHRHVRPESLEPEQLTMLWQGKINDEFAEASVIGTTAIILKLLEKVEDQEQAEQMATNFWLARDRHKFN